MVLAVWYVLAVRVVRSRGRQWAWTRTASFLGGCIALAAVTGLAIDGYGYRLFSAFMFQHLTLSILVPPLLVLGAPGQLLLRSTPHRGLGRYVVIAALGGLRCRASRIAAFIAASMRLSSSIGVKLPKPLRSSSWKAEGMRLV